MNGAATPEPKAASTSPPPQVPLEWRFSQVFGERGAGEDVQDVDIISAIEFNKSGHHLATGDRGGRVVLFERTDAKDDAPRKEAEKADYSISRHPEFRYKTEFQSHEPEFDYLKSLEIEEKINKIKWCQGTNGASFLLSTNDKTIKFWKVQEKKVKKICEMNLDPSNAPANGSPAGNNMVGPSTRIPNGGFLRPGGPPLLRLPVVVVLDSYLKKYTLNLSDTIIVLIPCIPIELNLYILISETSVYAGFTFIFVICYIYLTFAIHQVTSQEISLAANCRRVYAHAHDYHINSISNNSDGETFISADDLRINLWNLEISNQSFNIIDVKPTNMEDLTEVITCAEFHPSHCNTLAYSSSKGSIRLVDLRQSALCDTHSQLFEQHEAPGSRSFFTEIIASISDIKFSKDGRHILSRDYMTLKLWDVNMDSGPVATFQVHEYLRPKLCDLYENDSIFDKFECCQSGDGSQVATGSYSNIFRVFNCGAGGSEVTTLEATRNPTRRQIQNPARPARSLSSLTRVVRRGAENTGIDANGNSYDLSTKLLHLAWHPDENLIACAAANSLYMYYA